MNFAIVIDVILGMVFIFLVFSLIASAINESIAAIFDSRSRWLAYGIRRLLQTMAAGNTVSSKTANVKAKKQVEEFFAQLLLSYLGRTPVINLGTPEGRSPKAIPPDLALPALLKTALEDNSKIVTSLAEIDLVISALPDSALKANLEQLRAKGQNSFKEFEADFTKWFEDFGNEVSRWRLCPWPLAVLVKYPLNLA